MSKFLKSILVLLLLFTLSLNLYAKKVYEKEVLINKIISVYDGDTFRVNIKNFSAIVGENIPIRVFGVDTPEKRGKCINEKILANKAQQFTYSFVTSCKKLVLKDLQRGKYFRIVAKVYCEEKSLAKELIKNNLAVHYLGKTKTKDWCKK